MTENETDNLIETNEQPETTRISFPILAQLSLLAILLLIIFTSWWWPGSNNNQDNNAEQIATPTFVTESPPSSQTPNLEEVIISAKSAFVWDVRGERALYKKNPDEILPLASITKLMTALLAYELFEDDEKIAIPYVGILQEGSSGLSTNEVFRARELADLALISSSNDAAYSLAAAVGQLLGDSNPNERFVAGMNIRADELGFESLEFLNTTGLDESPSQAGAYGNARDVSFLMEYIVENYPEILNSTTLDQTRIYNENGQYHEAENTNDIVLQIPNIIGSKTGYTDLAGGNLTIAFDAGFNRPIIVTVLGSTLYGRFADVRTLVEAVEEALKYNKQN